MSKTSDEQLMGEEKEIKASWAKDSACCIDNVEKRKPSKNVEPGKCG